jgi:hypothetical protein
MCCLAVLWMKCVVLWMKYLFYGRDPFMEENALLWKIKCRLWTNIADGQDQTGDWLGPAQTQATDSHRA